MGNQPCLAQDPTAMYPPHNAHCLALAPLPTWGCVVSGTRALHHLFLCSSEVLISPEPFHPSFPNSDVPYMLPIPSVAAKLLTLKGKCPTVQNVPVCRQDEPNQKNKCKHPANCSPFIIQPSLQSSFCLQERFTS